MASASAKPALASTLGLATAAQIECGDFHSCLRTKDGHVACWGRDADGQLGTGGGDNVNYPREVPGLSDITQIALGGAFSCALHSTGRVTCWGKGRINAERKQLASQRPTPIRGLTDVRELSASGIMMCALHSDGTVTCFGRETAFEVFATSRSAAPPTAEGVAVASAHACALTADRVVCAGDDIWGKELNNLPFGSMVDSKSVANAAPKSLVSGDSFACILHQGSPYCVGRNLFGEFAVASDMDLRSKWTRLATNAEYKKIAAGEAQLCGVKADGTVRCWGGNSQGELGMGTTTQEELPADIPQLRGVRDICMASVHSCALLENDTIRCWGSNSAGQLGDGTRESRNSPVAVRSGP
jgi:alpha-tubulin suppressor-like RCC1 family protein